jgi:hypothetical protein
LFDQAYGFARIVEPSKVLEPTNHMSEIKARLEIQEPMNQVLKIKDPRANESIVG